MNWDTALVGIILGGGWIAREWQNWRERRELLDRIMSVDFREYKRWEKKPASPQPVFPVNMSEEDLAAASERRG